MKLTYTIKQTLKLQVCESHRLRKKAGFAAAAVLAAGLLVAGCASYKSACYQLYDPNKDRVMSVSCEFRVWKGSHLERSRRSEAASNYTTMFITDITANGIEIDLVNLEQSRMVKSEDVLTKFRLRLNYDGTAKADTKSDPLELMKSFLGAKSIKAEPTENPREAKLIISTD